MAKCVYCESDTWMYQDDEPICTNCAGRLDAGEMLTTKHPASESGSINEKSLTAGS
jgi:hypothetical protein